MVDFVAVSDAALTKGRPWTFRLARIFRDNLQAVISGVPGAPRISPYGIGGFTPGPYLLHTNAPGVQMTNASGFQKWKETIVAHDGTYTAKFNYSLNNGFGASAQLFVGDNPVGSPQSISGSGEISADVTVTAGQSVQVRGNGGSNPGSSGTVVSNLRLFGNMPLNFASVS